MTFHPQNFGEEKICYFTKCEYSHSTFYRQGVPTSFGQEFSQKLKNAKKTTKPMSQTFTNLTNLH